MNSNTTLWWTSGVSLMGVMSLLDNDTPVIVFRGGDYLMPTDTSTEEFSRFMTIAVNDVGVVDGVEGGDGADMFYQLLTGFTSCCHALLANKACQQLVKQLVKQIVQHVSGW